MKQRKFTQIEVDQLINKSFYHGKDQGYKDGYCKAKQELKDKIEAVIAPINAMNELITLLRNAANKLNS